MIARFVLLLIPFVIVGVLAWRGARAVTLGRLPASMVGAGVISAVDTPAVLRSMRRLRSARSGGALIGLVASAVPVLVFRGGVVINVTAILGGAVLGAIAGQWWVGRAPRHPLRSAPLVRRRVVDLIGPMPPVAFGTAVGAAVLADVGWLLLQPAGRKAHTSADGHVCFPPVVASVSEHLMSWAVICPVLLLAVGGSLVILHRAVDPTVPAPADSALRAAAIRTALGGGMLFAGGHALATYLDYESFYETIHCLAPRPWWYGITNVGALATAVLLLWCVTVYILAPARRPKPLMVPINPEVVAPA